MFLPDDRLWVGKHKNTTVELYLEEVEAATIMTWKWRIVAIQDKPCESGFKVMGVTPTTEEIIFTTEFIANSVVEARYKSMLFINKSDVAGLFKNMANWCDANKKMMVRKHRRENPSWYQQLQEIISLPSKYL